MVARLTVCGVLVGAAVAALTFPMAAAAGMVVRALRPDTVTVPAVLRQAWTPRTTYVYANDGKTLITAFYSENRQDVTLRQVAPVMRQAMVAAEDTRFYQHGGVDPRSVARAFVANDKAGATRQGASTLTMQYVRNVLKEAPDLAPQERVDATADTIARKIREMRYAIAMEKTMSKDEILTRYLNIAYFGSGAYGIYAAARTYFSKDPSQLTLAEAALLAGLVQSPDTYNPITGDRAAALVRRTYVLTALTKMKAITPAQAQQTEKVPLRLTVSREPNDCTAVPAGHNDWGYFCDYFRQWWDAQPAFGRTPAERDDALNTGGYRVVLSLDPAIQATAQNQSLAVYGYGQAKSLPMAIVTPGTGRVLALAVNRHYSLADNPYDQDYPNSVDQLVAGGTGVDGYQSGSTFKLFTMLAALESGRPLSTGFHAPSPLVTKWVGSGGSGNCGGSWCPANDTPSWMNGYRTMWDGYGRSVNTYFVWLEEQVGADKAIAMAKRLGIVLRSEHDAMLANSRPAGWGSFTLGVAQTTPLDLANAYATVAADGIYCKPLPVLSITGPDGLRYHAGDPSCYRAVSADVARAAVDAARCPVGQQSAYGKCNGGTAPSVGYILGRPVGGKTGSSEGNATETFVGFTPQLAGAAIAADPDNPSDSVGGGVASSVDDAVAHTLASALRGKPVLGFPAPSRAIAFGRS
jgi:membrane peptidoglycan carboxypeptidase